jgi:ketosteroid isomerase-like protein
MRMRLTSTYLVVTAMLAGGFAAPAPPTSATLADADVATVRAMFTATPEYMRTGQMARWASQFADDALRYPPNAPAAIGRTAMQAWAEALPPIEVMEFTSVQVHGEGNFAWGTSAYQLKLAGLPLDTGKQLVVVHKDADGQWRGVAVSFNSDLPAPTGAGGGDE